jgi:hypothetical protein
VKKKETIQKLAENGVPGGQVQKHFEKLEVTGLQSRLDSRRMLGCSVAILCGIRQSCCD